MGQHQDQDGEHGPSEKPGADADKLPNVEAPKLADEESAAQAADRAGSPRGGSAGALPALFSEAAEETSRERAAASSAQSRSLRFVLLAATIACAAGLGALVGSLSASGIGSRSVAEAPHARTADARDVMQALKMQTAELSSLKASVDAANRSAGTQFAKIADRLSSLERAQADPDTKLSQIADAVDRLDKHAAAAPAPETTGSIAASPQAPVAAAEASLPILRNWEIEGVRGGRALIVSRYGGEYIVSSGSNLPGVGHVQEIKRQNGEWMVVTEKGVITSGR